MWDRHVFSRGRIVVFRVRCWVLFVRRSFGVRSGRGRIYRQSYLGRRDWLHRGHVFSCGRDVMHGMYARDLQRRPSYGLHRCGCRLPHECGSHGCRCM